ncbi:MAG: hypothetical protein BMS9Abin39_0057 [Ignavibacteria bacterium]|nr:MAG: hypothetical protein BMS9Abin39_0057 [Ignavibacteria bacterium]
MIILFLFIADESFPQACCSAGSPLLGSLDVSNTSEGILQVGLTYEFNSLQDVYARTVRLDDDFRERRVNSFLLVVNYGLTERISLSTLFTFINQSRNISSLGDLTSRLNTGGLSDGIILVKYNFIPLSLIDQIELTLGVGAKLPIGNSTLRSDGILIPADMQPGTGAWDGVLWGYFSKGFMPALPLNGFLNVSYRLNGTNNRFGDNFQQGYTFGNELFVNLGAGYRTDTFFDFTIMLRFRNTTPDKFDGGQIPNTGGNWLYFVPGVNGKISDQLTARLSGQIPLYRNLTGTQLTTTYTASIGLFYNINLNGNQY